MNLPKGFAEKYERLLEEEATAFLATFDTEPVSGYRLNPLRADVPARDVAKEIPWSEFGERGRIDGNGILHVSGLAYSQEPSAQGVGTVAAPTPGETVLDLCAAPGGKTTHLASYLKETGVLVANEIHPMRAQVLSGNVERFGLRHTIVTNNDPDTLAKAWPETFDRILVDAPCSGEGMFRKDPDAVSYWTPEYPLECAARQKKILDAALTMLKPGGKLIYSTCTFAPEEDEQIAAWLVSSKGLIVDPITLYPGWQHARPEWADGNPDIAGAVRLWPQALEGEGHFIARFIKPVSEDEPAQKRAKKVDRKKVLPASEKAVWENFVKTTFKKTDWLQGSLVMNRDHLALRPSGAPDLSRVKVVRGGLELGTFKRNRFEASHSLSTALSPADFVETVELDADEFARYRHGETISRSNLSGKRTVLLTHEGHQFALGRLVNGTIKNAYPKGLRK